MNNNRKRASEIAVTIIALAFVLLVATIIIFDSDYSLSAEEAFNDGFTPNAATGSVITEKAIGIYRFTDTKCLYLCKINGNRLLVAEMKTKGKEYLYNGDYYIYSLNDEPLLTEGYNVTDTTEGEIKWEILLSKPQNKTEYGITDIVEFKYSETQNIFLVVLE